MTGSRFTTGGRCYLLCALAAAFVADDPAASSELFPAAALPDVVELAWPLTDALRFCRTDGVTNALGLTHEVALPYAHWRLIRGGVEISHAATKGSDYTFNGINLFAASAFPLTAGLELSLTGSVGYRQYPDFEFTPSRNEIARRAGFCFFPS